MSKNKIAMLKIINYKTNIWRHVFKINIYYIHFIIKVPLFKYRLMFCLFLDNASMLSSLDFYLVFILFPFIVHIVRGMQRTVPSCARSLSATTCWPKKVMADGDPVRKMSPLLRSCTSGSVVLGSRIESLVLV